MQTDQVVAVKINQKDLQLTKSLKFEFTVGGGGGGANQEGLMRCCKLYTLYTYIVLHYIYVGIYSTEP